MSTNAFLFSSFKISVKPESNSHRSQSQLIKTVQQFRASELLVYTYIYIYAYVYIYICFLTVSSVSLSTTDQKQGDKGGQSHDGLEDNAPFFFVSPLQPIQLIKCFPPRHFPIQITAALASRERNAKRKKEAAWLQFKRAASVQ